MIHTAYRAAIAALLVAVLLMSNASGDKKDKKPNVLVIMSDDQDLLMNSMDYMPNVRDQIGAHGITFSKHYCTSAFCCPSRVSLYTGKCVHNTNVTSVVTPHGGYPKFISQGLNEDYLPLWLQKGGINTYYVGKFANEHSTHNYRKTPIKGWTAGNFLLDPGMYDYTNSTWAKNQDDWQSFPGEHAIDIVTKHSLEMIDEAVGSGKPWFMTVAPAVPHGGINATTGRGYLPIPQKKWKNAFPNAIVPRTPNWNPDEMNMGVGWIRNLPKQNEATVKRLDRVYRARVQTIAGLDDMVGDLISALDKHGVLDNTHIIYTTDNGYHIGQHRMGPGKKQGLETDVNIPMVWRGPGVSSGKTSDAVSTHTDLAPTFLSLFGLPQRSNLDGRFIHDILPDDSDEAGEHVNIELWGSAAPYELAQPRGLRVALTRQNTYKGLRIHSGNSSGDYSLYYSVWCTNERELYDMTKDPWQNTNLLPGVRDLKADVNASTSVELAGRPLSQAVHRLDAVLMVLKTCVGEQCTQPWKQLHPRGDVSSLRDALASKYDDFYSSQGKIEFSGCRAGYLKEFEGPTEVEAFSAGGKIGAGGDDVWFGILFWVMYLLLSG